MNEIREKVESLERMSMVDLREAYGELFGESTNSGNWRWMFRRCVWRVQALAEGGLPIRAKKRAMEIADDADARVIPPRDSVPELTGPKLTEPVDLHRDSRLPAPGVTLKRLFKGAEYFVKVLPNGFEFHGEFHRSLSAIAHAITGNHWNGYNFFRKALDYAKANEE